MMQFICTNEDFGYKELYARFNVQEVKNKENMIYVKLSDLDKLCDLQSGFDCTVWSIVNYELLKNAVEIFYESEIPENGFYIRLISDDIHIFSYDNKKYTDKKIDKITDSLLQIVYMKSLQEVIKESKIYETLLRTVESEKFSDVLNRFFDEQNIVIKFGSNSKTHDTLEILTDKNLEKIPELWKKILQIANLGGYKVNSLENKIKNSFSTIFIPYHADLCNDIVDENDNIVYHLTSKYFLNKALKCKFIPFRLEFGWEGKSRLYLFCGEINKNFELEVVSFKNQSIMQMKFYAPGKITSYYEKNILVKIDLNKTNRKFNFYHDPAYKSKINPMYTKDKIPTECIVGFHKIENNKLNYYEKI